MNEHKIRYEKIEFLKKSFGFKSDKELAEKLGIARKTIHSYKNELMNTYSLLIDTTVKLIKLEERVKESEKESELTNGSSGFRIIRDSNKGKYQVFFKHYDLSEHMRVKEISMTDEQEEAYITAEFKSNIDIRTNGFMACLVKDMSEENRADLMAELESWR